MTELLSLSVAIFAGLMMTRVMSRWRLPDVTAYLVAGAAHPRSGLRQL